MISGIRINVNACLVLNRLLYFALSSTPNSAENVKLCEFVPSENVKFLLFKIKKVEIDTI